MAIISWLKGKLKKKSYQEEVYDAKVQQAEARKIRAERLEELRQPRPRIRDMAISSKPRKAIHQDHSKFFKRRKGQSLEYYKTTKKHTKKEELDEL